MLAPGLQLLIDATRANPTHLAVDTVGGSKLYHGALLREISYLCTTLREHGVRRGSRVGLHLGRTVEHVIAMYAVWGIGAVWVSIDPEQPVARRASLIARSKVDFLLTQSQISEFDAPQIAYAFGDESPRPSTCEPWTDVHLDDDAYIIWTSGSTGAPKGVAVPHSGIESLVRAQMSAFMLTPEDRSLWMLSSGFDAHVSDVLTILSAGGTLVIDPRPSSTLALDWFDLLRRHEITVCDVPPAVLRRHAYGALPKRVKTLIVGGEPTDPVVLRKWGRAARVVSVYGPTEATVCTHLRAVSASWGAPVLGDPIEGVLEHVTDDGELWLGGPCLARGYLGDPELTAQRFVHREDGARWFATRDKVRRTPDGLAFVGRLDRQAKIHGKLVAPEEVEAAIAPLVAPHECVVFVGHNADGDADQLRVAVEGVSAHELSVARERLSAMLPAHLCPAVWSAVPVLPRTPSGKVSVTDLLAVAAAATPLESEALSPSEQLILGVLRELLRSDKLGINGDFFDHGGDSIAALAVASTLERRGFTLQPSAVYGLRTARAMAAVAQEAHLLTAGHREYCLDLSLIAARYLAAASVDRNDRDDRGAAVHAHSRIVLTSGTGLVGSATLASLLRQGASVTVLVRAKSNEEARSRVLESQSQWGLVLEDFDESKVQCLAIDPDRPYWGWGREQYIAVASQTATTVNTAGRVHLIADCASLSDDNVLSALDALEFAAKTPTKSLIHTSTLSVVVASSAAATHCGDDWIPRRLVRLVGGYAQSKWIAERLLEGCAAVKTLNVRLGLVVGDSVNGYAGPRDQLGVCLRVLAGLGAYPERLDPMVRCDTSPVDRVALCLAALAMRGVAKTETVNCASREGVSWGQWLNALERAGIVLKPVASEQWFELLDAAVLDAKSEVLRSELLVARWSFVRAQSTAVLPAASDLFAATQWRFESAKIEALLAELGFGPMGCEVGAQDSIVRAALSLR